MKRCFVLLALLATPAVAAAQSAPAGAQPTSLGATELAAPEAKTASGTADHAASFGDRVLLSFVPPEGGRARVTGLSATQRVPWTTALPDIPRPGATRSWWSEELDAVIRLHDAVAVVQEQVAVMGQRTVQMRDGSSSQVPDVRGHFVLSIVDTSGVLRQQFELADPAPVVGGGPGEASLEAFVPFEDGWLGAWCVRSGESVIRELDLVLARHGRDGRVEAVKTIKSHCSGVRLAASEDGTVWLADDFSVGRVGADLTVADPYAHTPPTGTFGAARLAAVVPLASDYLIATDLTFDTPAETPQGYTYVSAMRSVLLRRGPWTKSEPHAENPEAGVNVALVTALETSRGLLVAFRRFRGFEDRPEVAHSVITGFGSDGVQTWNVYGDVTQDARVLALEEMASGVVQIVERVNLAGEKPRLLVHRLQLP